MSTASAPTAMVGAPVLEIRGLTIALPATGEREHAVHDASISVGAGEMVCLVGESGSGKSVIAQATMGLLPAALRVTSGSILVDGEDVLRASAHRLRELRCTRMSMVFQEPMTALNPVLTCGEQIEEVLAFHTTMSVVERRKRSLAMVHDVGLSEPGRMLASYPHQLSGGQRQRIMIAMALVLDPRLLIADEPTTALDVTTQAQILALIRDMRHEHGTGVLFITHDFGVVAEIADKVAVLRRGEVVEFGEARALLTNPQHEYTRMLIASVPRLVPRRRIPTSDGRVMLATRRLGKRYVREGWLRLGKNAGAVDAASGIDLEICRGETLGLVGESGSGKSTVARCIARLVEPSAGVIMLDGTDIATMGPSELRPLRRRVQIVFQDPYRSLNPRRTIREALIEGPMNYGATRTTALATAHNLLDLVKIDAAALERYPHQFSGGQRQRICIARALAVEPELLIADEAVSALDVSVQAQVLALLDEIRLRFNLAMLFITHDLRVAAQVCDRVAVMQRGRIVETGPTTEVYENPRHEYTRALLAAAPGRDWDFAVAARSR